MSKEALQKLMSQSPKHMPFILIKHKLADNSEHFDLLLETETESKPEEKTLLALQINSDVVDWSRSQKFEYHGLRRSKWGYINGPTTNNSTLYTPIDKGFYTIENDSIIFRGEILSTSYTVEYHNEIYVALSPSAHPHR